MIEEGRRTEPRDGTRNGNIQKSFNMIHPPSERSSNNLYIVKLEDFFEHSNG